MPRSLVTVAAAIGVIITATVAGSQPVPPPLKVGFIYVGPANDGGWTQGHDQARQEMEAALGDRVETTYLESVPTGADADRQIERLVRAGNQLIFTTSFEFMDPTIRVAAQFPNVRFEHATGFKRADNVAIYNARFYEGRYVIGQIAARMSTTGVAGYIASFPIPEVVMGINAFLLGAQSVNPGFSLKVIWLYTWYDPGREADAAKALIDQGADILTQHTDSPAPLRIAEERGVHGFGQAHDMIAFAPNAQYTAIVDHWGSYYTERAQAMLDGTWSSTDIWYGLKEGMVQMAPFTNLPDDVVAMAEETIEAIKSGELHPFHGPIYRQDGTLAIPEGQVIPDADLLAMNWYVQGVDDRLPQ